MEGIMEYAADFDRLIDEKCAKYQDRPYLRGFADFLSTGSSETTVYGYVLCVSRFMDSAGKNVGELCLNDYTNFLRSKKCNTSSYQIMVYSALSRFSQYLLASGLAEADPMRYVARPKFQEGAKTIKKRNVSYLDRKEIGAYLDSVKNGHKDGRMKKYHEMWKERDMLLVQIFLNTGARCSGLCKLDVGDLDLDGMSVTFTEKGGKTYICKLGGHMEAIAREWLVKRLEILDGIPEDALFISRGKHRIGQRSVYNIVKRYGEGVVKIPMSPHKLRATFGTQLYAKSKDIVFVKECMHHSNTKVTEIYIRDKNNKSAQTAANIMAGLTDR